MKKKLRFLLSNQFVQGSFLFTISNIIVSIFNYFFNFLAGRYLGPINYGEIVTFFSYTAIFSLPFTVTSSIIVQKIGSKDINNYAYTKALELWFINKIKKWWFLLVSLIFIAPFIPRITNVSSITGYLIIITIILSPFSVFYNSALNGLKLFLAITIISIITTFIKLLGAILVGLKVDGLLTIFSCLIISVIFNLIAATFSFKKYINYQTSELKIDKRLKEAIINGYFLLTLISIISITLLSNLDIIFVKKFFLPGEAGYFAAWSLFAKIIFYLVGPFVSLSFVFFSSKKNADQQDKILLGTFLILAIVSLICFLLYTFFPVLVEIIFGNKFKYIMKFLPLAAIFGVFYSAINLFSSYFLAKKSLFTLILPVFFPIYICLLFIFRDSLIKIMKIDIFFTFSITLIFLIAYIYQKKFNRLFIISS